MSSRECAHQDFRLIVKTVLRTTKINQFNMTPSASGIGRSCRDPRDLRPTSVRALEAGPEMAGCC